jgi:D-alanine-D-alanine ligase-like ATP-grasp enzyme
MEFNSANTAGTSQLGKELMQDKAHSRTLLELAGVPIARGRVFALEHHAEALQFAESLGWPVVIKPVDGSGGKGVFSGLASAAEFEQAYDELGRLLMRPGMAKRFLVEEHVDGIDYRFYALNGRVLSVLTRRPGSVVGDGKRTVSQLATRKNRERRKNPHLGIRPLRLGVAAAIQLKRQGLTLDSVPRSGQVVALTTAANLSQGGESVEIYDETHASLMDIAARAAMAVPGVTHVGVDFLIPDHRVPADRQKVAICEVNGTPGGSANDFPMYGTPRPVTPAAFEEAARLRNVRLRPAQPSDSMVHIVVSVHGCDRPETYRDWLLDRTAQLHVKVWGQRVSRDELEFKLTGRLDDVAAAVSGSIQGTTGAQPSYVESRLVRKPLARAVVARIRSRLRGLVPS